jgi:hypothetical protein
MYRKFVATLPMGKPAQNYHGSYILYPQQALVIDLDLVHSLVEGDYLLAQIVGLGGVLDQYAKNHYVEDFLRYCAIAVELGVLDRNEVVIFFTQNMLIPGGAEFGVLPIPVFIDIVGRLESICKAFVDMHRPVSDEPYQSRALAFCNERLGSYLLMKRLTTDFRCEVTALPSNFFGFMHTVVKPGAVGV